MNKSLSLFVTISRAFTSIFVDTTREKKSLNLWFARRGIQRIHGLRADCELKQEIKLNKIKTYLQILQQSLESVSKKKIPRYER